MAIFLGNQNIKPEASTYEYLKSLENEDLSDSEARLTLARFLKSNIRWLYEHVTHRRMYPMQELVIKSLFLRDRGIIVAHRGWAKSWILSVVSWMIPLLSPGAQVCLISANFRGARKILADTEKMIHSNNSPLLEQCFENRLRRNNDIYELEGPHNSKVYALPLNAEGLRGHRASWLFIDEGLNVSKEIQENVLQPFLAVKQNAAEEMDIRAAEDELISKGVITEEDRVSLPSNKLFILSSASFRFQYLYEVWQSYLKNIMESKPAKPNEKKVSYFAMRYSYKVLEQLPNHAFLDMSAVNQAKETIGENSDSFQREWMGLFPDISDGYFNIQTMHQCTVRFEEEPTLQLKGDKDCKFLLTIDPSYSSAKSSDDFAMSVYLLEPIERKIFQVHTYAIAGQEIRQHFLYLSYLLTHFNIVFIAIDQSGGEFLTGFNESTIAKEKNIKLQFLDADLEKDQINELNEELIKARNQYNLTGGRIVYAQSFASLSQRRMNEHLKNQIDAKKIWFASRMSIEEKNVKLCKEIINSFKLKTNEDEEFEAEDFLERQNTWIEETKAQTALIQVSATVLGTLQYNHPQSIRRSTSADRPRKDSYTTLLMGATAASNYFNIMSAQIPNNASTFAPIIIR